MLSGLIELARAIAFVDDVRANVTTFLLHHRRPKTLAHSLRVAAEAQRLAQRFDQTS